MADPHPLEASPPREAPAPAPALLLLLPLLELVDPLLPASFVARFLVPEKMLPKLPDIYLTTNRALFLVSSS